MSCYWIVYKNGKYLKSYIKNSDSKTYSFVKDKKEAKRFYDFGEAMQFFNEGFAISKEYS